MATKKTDAKAKIATADVTPLKVDLSKSKTGIITIPGIRSKIIHTLIIGTAPLVMNKFSSKALNMIAAKQAGEASIGREAKNPDACFNDARHRLPNGDDGFPAGGLKSAVVSGCSKETGLAMTQAKGALRILPDDPGTNLVRIHTPNDPRMRQDIVRNQTGVVDIRYRPEYWPWAMHLMIEFLPNLATEQRLLQAVAMAGFRVGIGEWRPSSKESRSGSWGTFRLATAEEAEWYEDGVLWDRVDFTSQLAAAAE